MVTDLPEPRWAVDPCPPAPLVLAAHLGLPPGATVALPWLVGDVHAAATFVSAADRARALALLLPASHGVLVRGSAAWVWSGDDALRPQRLDLALPEGGPSVPGPRPSPERTGLPVVRTRWLDGATWTVLAGVALSGPHRTASECARLLPPDRARTCLQALARSPGLQSDRLRAVLHKHPHRPGTRRALRLLTELEDDHVEDRRIDP